MFMRRFIGASKFVCKRPKSTLAIKFDESVNLLPLRDAVRYTEFNKKVTAADFKNKVNSHANALLEFNIDAKDTLAVWLPEGPEKHVILLAAAKSGIKVVDIDINLTEISEVREFLKVANCKVLYFKPVHQEHDYLMLLRQSIPEFFHYEDDHGQLFHSKHFRSLRYFIHTGFDLENGCLNFDTLMLPHPFEDMAETAAAKTTDNDVIYQQISKGSNGLVVGEPVTTAKVLEQPAFHFAKKMIERQYFEFGGPRFEIPQEL